MVGISSGGRGADYSRAIGKNPKAISEMNFKKGVRKPAEQAAPESVIEGVTHDSIAEFVASRENTVEPVRAAPTGLFDRLKRILGR